MQNADEKPNNSSANSRLPEFLAQSITMPAGLLGSICCPPSITDLGSLEGKSLTGRKKRLGQLKMSGFMRLHLDTGTAFNSLWNFTNPQYGRAFLWAFCVLPGEM